MSGFERIGRPRNLDDDARMECGICWHVYDPALGDDEWQIPPGTPFSALPEGWCCPNCDASVEAFLKVEG